MRNKRIYLDTSIINFLFAADAPEFQRITQEFFAQHSTKYDLFISNIVLLEIAKDPNQNHRILLENTVSEYSLKELPPEPREEIQALAAAYMDATIIPARKTEDALHVAYATIHEMDVLLSWNFKHLANIAREERFLEVNRRLGYRYPLRLASPLEVADED